MSNRSTGRYRESWSAAGTALAVAGIYVATAKLGLSMAFVAAQVTVVWPPSGIALVAVILLGPARAWPGIALGAFLANATAGESLATAAGIAAGNTLEALTGAWLLSRVEFRPALDRLRDVLALIVLAAMVSTAVSATIGVVSLCWGGVQPWSAAAGLWWIWWVGDALGDLVVVPLLLVWATRPTVSVPTERRGEAIALIVATIAVGALAFAGRPAAVTGYPLHYTVFPFVIWAALRFGQRGTASVVFLTAGLAIWGTLHGQMPFTARTLNETLLTLQIFMAVVAGTGLVLGAVIAERDAARRRATAEYERLHVGEERLRLALDAGRMGVWDWNLTTGEVKWTDNLEPIHGLAPGTFPGTIEGFQALVHPPDREQVQRTIERAVAERSGYEIEFRNLRADGTVGWISGSGRVLCDEQGQAVRMLGVATDVTERRRLADELAAQAGRLAEGDRHKDEFLAMLAHELRNPLAPLGTALRLLRANNEGRERFLAMAERQLKQLVRLVDDLLDVSRITQGKITLRKEPVRLDEVVARAVEMVQPLIDAHGHRFEVSLPPDLIWLDADPSRLAQIIANLLTNAADYTPAGGSIWLGVEQTAEAIVVRVRDTGVGLPPEILPAVFDMFVQGDGSLARTGGGLGIGLTIVRRLVELHGGDVAARSAGVGQGSEFVVRLPKPPLTFAGAADVRPAPPPVDAHGGLRVLIVEDQHDAAESLATLLGLWGHEVRVAFDGGAALDTVERWPPDVVLSDVGLPGMDGYELAAALRRRSDLEHVVLIALSGYGRDEERQRAFASGFDFHLVKPPDFDALIELLGRIATRAVERLAVRS